MTKNWTQILLEQLEFYWDANLRSRLDGLTDDEYLWEPVAGCWSVRKGDDGRYLADWQAPPPDPRPVTNIAWLDPRPVTTIAWRLAHIAAYCFANRASAFFGDGSVPEDATMFDQRHVPDLPGTADDAIAFLERSYAAWHAGVASLSEDDLMRPLGPKGAAYADEPMAALVLHISREAMHHGGEIGLLRDLYRAGLGRSG